MNILITGGNGYIARALYDNLKHKYNITTTTRQNFDLSSYDATCEWFNERQFDVVLHTAIAGGSRLQEDDSVVLQQNLAMYNNLRANRHHFKKLISFGSGAELHHGDTPYANSKREIAESIETTENFYNLRIFNAFDENELLTRFIKANILRYIKKETIIINANKIMDFIYMPDLISTVEYYITNTHLEKDINCCYEEKYTLKTIANIINSLDTHKVPIVTYKTKLEFYCGDSGLPPINIVGLQQGIQNTFLALSK
jgi:nucleoside-diphosphate-sugar epimerase